ncbi:hypothetical protein GTO89_16725 [Heliobacterium gestii]|uniref:Uncharacterized protein n=1 Tax=Heliomicrobium gestii TaxID=2699 RepID=A0A845LHZ6_HELGE|nr:hypothetical protein [Heliomicrobium gestii]MBM7868514.1 hypothetical protein [Heliomicrobium gestii]MZP44660.1 hypothetical protein [Heliomicrobium gestii]
MAIIIPFPRPHPEGRCEDCAMASWCYTDPPERAVVSRVHTEEMTRALEECLERVWVRETPNLE